MRMGLGSSTVALIIAFAQIGCEADSAPAADAAATTSADAGIPVHTDGGDASALLTPCLDRPTDLPRPPTAGLPCELLPPGFPAQ